LNSLTNLLPEHPLFMHLPKDTLEDLVRGAIKKTYTSQEIVVHHEDVWPNLFLLAKGEINAVKQSPEGRTFIATSLRAGDVFWGLSFFIEGAPMPVYLQAKQDSTIYTWSREDLIPIIKDNGIMAWKLCQMMIKRMQIASVIVEDLAFHPVMSRLAGLLLDIFAEAEDEFVARDLTLEDMASHIGTTREMVCRHLYRFAEEGAIEISRTELRITDREFLEMQLGK
jgi:CRP/FNR family cyclic AMP-dependent transcriptional regulator